MKIAVEGCAHGELEKIYDTLTSIEERENIKIDLLICCGDFQATRNLDDLQTMAVPEKYMDMCTFYKYYSGEKVAPILTVFVGGNHEASNYLQELPYGGWVAPNIYYLGNASVVNVNGIRIAGISGIYKGHDFLRGHFEFAPYSQATKRSVYHIRQLETFRLKQLSGNIDIFISHDWPRGIYDYGDAKQLIRFKPHFREEIDANTLGSPPAEELLKELKPSYWFAAHLHCKFAALVPHENSEKVTKFLALDKCLPKRRFLQVLDIETTVEDEGTKEKIKLEYDLEWLTILCLTNHLLSVTNSVNYMPGPNGLDRFNFTPTSEEKEEILRKFDSDLRIPENFCKTVEPYNPDTEESLNIEQREQRTMSQINPQTSSFCDKLGIDDPVSVAMIINGHDLIHSNSIELEESANMENTTPSFVESTIDESFLSETTDPEVQNIPSPVKRQSLSLPKPKVVNEEEINIDDDDNIPTVSESDIYEHKREYPQKNLDEKGSEFPASSPIKKFKRRNESIYGAQNDQ